MDGKSKKPWGSVAGRAGHLKGHLCRWEEVWFPSFHSVMSLPSQVPNATKQDSVAAAIEWQRKLEAAEALLALRNSPVRPPGAAAPQQGRVMPNNHLPEHGPQGGELVGKLEGLW